MSSKEIYSTNEGYTSINVTDDGHYIITIQDGANYDLELSPDGGTRTSMSSQQGDTSSEPVTAVDAAKASKLFNAIDQKYKANGKLTDADYEAISGDIEDLIFPPAQPIQAVTVTMAHGPKVDFPAAAMTPADWKKSNLSADDITGLLNRKQVINQGTPIQTDSKHYDQNDLGGAATATGAAPNTNEHHK